MSLKKGLIVMITSKTLGKGNDELGHLLMIKFIRSLETTSKIPEQILLLNSGIELAISDSPILDVLKRMENKGCTIKACSTCLKYFKLLEKLAVGKPGTMDDTVITLSEYHNRIIL